MKIRKVAVGNAAEAFIEGNFTNGVNIISSDDNNKGKTIVIQSMMYALGNEPTFPTSFEERLQSLMDDESVSLESIVAYKKDIFSASDAEARIKEIDMEVATLKSQLLASENASIETQEQRVALLSAIIGKMNELYHQIDPDGNIIYSSLFTQRK